MAMSTRKRLLIISVGAGAGFAVALSLIIGLALWYESQPKAAREWNKEAVKAELKEARAWDYLEEETRYGIRLDFDITNSMDRDYTLPTPSGGATPMQYEAGSLRSSPGLSWRASTGVTPYNLPGGFFDPKPILIPANETIRVWFYANFGYSQEITEGKTLHEIAIYFLRDVDSFILLDTLTHYRIELPLNSFEQVLDD